MEAEPESIPHTGVLCAKAVSYGRLAAADAAGAAMTLEISRDLVRRVASGFGGSLVDQPDHDVVVRFARAVHAVSCAVEIQSALEHRNAELPTQERMFFRVGVGLGHADETDPVGLEVAQRVRSLADPGGICVSGHARDEVEGRLPVAFEARGLQAVGGLPRPVRVYRVVPDPAAGGQG